MEERYGEYWRFPGLLDFCYLVNSFFPPQKMLDEIRASFDRIITQYPSGIKVNSLLAAKNLGIKAENIVVGNGASELIKSLLDKIDGKVGFIKPTFEEYPNRYNNKSSVFFVVENDDYMYDTNDITEFFEDKDINALVLINPDNPSGNYINKNNILSLAEWCGKRKIRLILDESFADFANEKDNTFIIQELLNKYTNVIVIKSLSKSYGIPGLRLGVLASGDIGLINWIKKDVSIWNINSFAEFYMQIEEKYKECYYTGLEDFRNERKRMYDELKEIKDIYVVPSQANYFMIRIISNYRASDIAKKLLLDYNILVKDLSHKLNRNDYLRIAIRNRTDNEFFVKSLKEILHGGNL